MNQVTDKQLQVYIDQVFNSYDHDRSGTLNATELATFFNDLFAKMGTSRKVNQWEAELTLKSIDANHDGEANKAQLFEAFKKLLTQPIRNPCRKNSHNSGWENQPNCNRKNLGWTSSSANQGWGNNQTEGVHNQQSRKSNQSSNNNRWYDQRGNYGQPKIKNQYGSGNSYEKGW